MLRALEVVVDGEQLFDCVQATWNLLERSAEPALRQAHDRGLGVTIKEALANGRLTARNQDAGFALQRRQLEATAHRLGATTDVLARRRAGATVGGGGAQRRGDGGAVAVEPGGVGCPLGRVGDHGIGGVGGTRRAILGDSFAVGVELKRATPPAVGRSLPYGGPVRRPCVSTLRQDFVLIPTTTSPSLRGALPMAVTFENAAELVKRLGNIPLEGICFKPPPGTATLRDLREALCRSDRLYELVDGTLVEKAMGLSESMVALLLARKIGNFAEEHDLGMPAGADGTVQLLKGLVRIPDVAFFCWDKLPGRVLPSKPIPDLAPDLAVEVLSASNTPAEMQRKLREYFLSGCPPRLDDRPRQAAGRGLHRRRSCRDARRNADAGRWRRAARFQTAAGRVVRASPRRREAAQKEALNEAEGQRGNPVKRTEPLANT